MEDRDVVEGCEGKGASKTDEQPFNYQPKFTNVYQTDPKWGFSGSERKSMAAKNCSPSMQAYSIPSKAIEGK